MPLLPFRFLASSRSFLSFASIDRTLFCYHVGRHSRTSLLFFLAKRGHGHIVISDIPPSHITGYGRKNGWSGKNVGYLQQAHVEDLLASVRPIDTSIMIHVRPTPRKPPTSFLRSQTIDRRRLGEARRGKTRRDPDHTLSHNLEKGWTTRGIDALPPPRPYPFGKYSIERIDEHNVA